ncbi:MAG: hypothetical protein WC343_10555 [Bacilli bacterium]|jgi:hypothetical protein
MPSYTLDLDRRTDALIDLLDCPVRWSSKQYIMILAENLAMKCDGYDRSDLSVRIQTKILEIV